MKLKIRKKFFDQLGEEKQIDFRDAHITFECEKTGRRKRADVGGVYLSSREKTKHDLKGVTEKEFENMFDDERQIAFVLGNVREVGIVDKVKEKIGVQKE